MTNPMSSNSRFSDDLLQEMNGGDLVASFWCQVLGSIGYLHSKVGN
jgi:hypothetical protein